MNIPYELAKELKDAGFPQWYATGDHHYSGHWIDAEGKPYAHNVDSETECYVPTLSELIEACTSYTFHFSLEQHSNDWRAGVYAGAKQFKVGSTPEEAVARLWLTLKEKSV